MKTLSLALIRGLPLAVLAYALPCAAPAQEAATLRAQEIVAKIDPVELRTSIDKLVAFGTRHTLSDTDSETRGIGAARRWVAVALRGDLQGLRRLPRDRDAVADLHRTRACRSPPR